MYYQKTILLIIFFFVFLTSESVLEVKQQTSLTHGLLNTLFPPNLDFRASSNGGGVKEVVATTLEKGKAALEESAKLAADVTKETAQKLEHTFSSSSSSSSSSHL